MYADIKNDSIDLKNSINCNRKRIQDIKKVLPGPKKLYTFIAKLYADIKKGSIDLKNSSNSNRKGMQGIKKVSHVPKKISRKDIYDNIENLYDSMKKVLGLIKKDSYYIKKDIKWHRKENWSFNKRHILHISIKLPLLKLKSMLFFIIPGKKSK